jgi:hypothetical protein
VHPGLLDTVTIRYRMALRDGPQLQDWTEVRCAGMHTAWAYTGGMRTVQITSVVDEIGGPEGLEFGIVALSKGAAATLLIHPEYAWGALGAPALGVPPDSWIAIDLELQQHTPLKVSSTLCSRPVSIRTLQCFRACSDISTFRGKIVSRKLTTIDCGVMINTKRENI